MYIIVGLGNPGKEYVNTRHNAGFMTIDYLADRFGIDVTTQKHKALVGKGIINGQKVVLAKPQTFMNLSGESVRELLDFYKPDEQEELIILYDDITLDVGGVRVRKNGSAGGHNGMKSIISHVGHQNFKRIRIGIGEKPAKMDLADWVLGHFHKEDEEKLKQGITNAGKALEMILEDKLDDAMNCFNRKVDRKA